jgi:neutral amino acid transport system permease protein
VLVGVALIMQKTRLGMSLRAVADLKDLAEASGIDVNRVILYTWIGCGALAALGGVLYGISDTVTWDMGFTLLLLMFAAVVLGGLGTAYGPMIGGVIIGVASQVSTYWISTKYRVGVALAVLIIAVLLRPQGILGRRERIG